MYREFNSRCVHVRESLTIILYEGEDHGPNTEQMEKFGVIHPYWKVALIRF